jgi:hypothetical protein
MESDYFSAVVPRRSENDDLSTSMWKFPGCYLSPFLNQFGRGEDRSLPFVAPLGFEIKILEEK